MPGLRHAAIDEDAFQFMTASITPRRQAPRLSTVGSDNRFSDRRKN